MFGKKEEKIVRLEESYRKLDKEVRRYLRLATDATTCEFLYPFTDTVSFLESLSDNLETDKLEKAEREKVEAIVMDLLKREKLVKGK